MWLPLDVSIIGGTACCIKTWKYTVTGFLADFPMLQLMRMLEFLKLYIHLFPVCKFLQCEHMIYTKTHKQTNKLSNRKTAKYLNYTTYRNFRFLMLQLFCVFLYNNCVHEQGNFSTCTDTPGKTYLCSIDWNIDLTAIWYGFFDQV